jgi:hypothetical protein
MLIQTEIRQKNKRCNRLAIVLGRLLLEVYPRRWVFAYEEMEQEYEDEHDLIEREYENMSYSCYQMEEAYEWVRLVYDN